MPLLPSEIGLYWHNFKTGEAEYLTATPEDRLAEFIPQSRAAQLLYRVHLQRGKTPLDAAVAVLEVAIHAQEGTGARPAGLAPDTEGH